MKRFFLPFFAGAGILGVSSLLSRLLGVYRDHLLATTFGATQGAGIYSLDVYYAAFRLPDLLYNFLILGAVSSAFLPIFSGFLAKGDKASAFSFANATMTFIGISMLILSFVFFFCVPFFVPLFVPGFSNEKLQLTIQLSRFMLLSPFFFGLSSVAQGIENAFQRFFAYALAPILYNLAIIVGIFWLAPAYGVWGITFGVIVGAFLHFASQVPALIRLGFRYRFILNVLRADMRRMLQLIGPRIIGLAGMQVQLIVETLIASTLAVGSVSILNFAFNISSLPLGVFGVSIAVAGFATLSQHAALSRTDHFSAEFRYRCSQILFWILPASAGLFVLREPLIQFLFEGGKFTAIDTARTSLTLAFFAVGLFSYSLLPLFARAFYAREDTKTPVFSSLFAITLHIALSFLLTKYVGFGVEGLAIAHAIANMVNVMILAFFLRRRLPHILHLSRSIVLYVALAVFMGFFVFVIDHFLMSFPLFFRLAIDAGFGAAFYLAFAKKPRHEHVGA